MVTRSSSPHARLVVIVTGWLLACGNSGDSDSDSSGDDTDDTGDTGDTKDPARRHTVGVMDSSQQVLLYAENASTAASSLFQVGMPRTWSSHLPLAGDLDGDGHDELAIYDTGAGTFHLKYQLAPGGADTVFAFGPRGGVPVLGDFDGDEVDTIGVFDPATATFHLRDSNSAGPADRTLVFGVPGAGVLPIAGDWDGDGSDTLGLFDPLRGEFRLADGEEGAPGRVFAFGPRTLTSVPVAGDWDGDGRDGVGVYDLVQRTFFLRDTPDAGAEDHTVVLPEVAWTWLPIAGRWTLPVQPAAVGYAWPTATPESQQVDPARLELAYAEAARNPLLFSLLVARNGKLVREEYFNGGAPALAHNIKSASKSMLSALVGIAIANGQLTGEETVASVLPEYFEQQDDVDPRKYDIATPHLLTMTAGLVWDEDQIGNWTPQPDWVAAALSAPMEASPGELWNYSNALTHITSAMLTRRTGQPTHVYAQEQLFAPLGMTAVRWDLAPDGIDSGGTEVWMVARDLARFGQLYLQRGDIDGRQLVSAAWVDGTTVPILAPNQVDDVHGYGCWWWTRVVAGRDTYAAQGYGGQYLWVVPSLQLVVVMTALADVDDAANHANFAWEEDLLDDLVLPAVTP